MFAHKSWLKFLAGYKKYWLTDYMTQKLTIQIGVDTVSEDLDAKMDTYLQKPPFDKRKVSAAALVVIGVVYGIGSLFLPAKVVVASEAPVKEVPVKEAPSKKASTNTVLVASKPVAEPEQKLEPTPVTTPVTTSESTSEPTPELTPILVAKATPVVSTPAVQAQKPVVEAAVKQSVENVQSKPKSQQHHSLLRAVLTTGVVENEPVDDLGYVLDTNGELTRRVYFFTELKQLNGQKIYHRWVYEGKQVAELTLPVRSDRWRTYSSKAMPKQWLGDWAVEVLDAKRNLLGRYEFSYSLGQ